jgi:hypothetical protein
VVTITTQTTDLADRDRQARPGTYAESKDEMVREADDTADRKEPIEVWLTKRNIGITCRVVKEDKSATELDAESLSMRGAMSAWASHSSARCWPDPKDRSVQWTVVTFLAMGDRVGRE